MSHLAASVRRMSIGNLGAVCNANSEFVQDFSSAGAVRIQASVVDWPWGP